MGLRAGVRVRGHLRGLKVEEAVAVRCTGVANGAHRDKCACRRRKLLAQGEVEAGQEPGRSQDLRPSACRAPVQERVFAGEGRVERIHLNALHGDQGITHSGGQRQYASRQHLVAGGKNIAGVGCLETGIMATGT